MNAVVSTILSVSLCLGVAVAGAYAIETIGKGTVSRDATGKAAMPTGTMSRTAPPVGTMAKDAMVPRAMTGDAMTRNVPPSGAMVKDAMKKDAQAR
ncbi:MAG: pentapeptide MXKDX repeat protein [Magnetospirillum sp.]|nr:pentapeptide MXKDX repeat protein [Magnetospirillum sp.]